MSAVCYALMVLKAEAPCRWRLTGKRPDAAAGYAEDTSPLVDLFCHAAARHRRLRHAKKCRRSPCSPRHAFTTLVSCLITPAQHDSVGIDISLISDISHFTFI